MRKMTELPALPARKADSHKGDCGRVLVVAGSRGMAGAATLCADAALRAGSGLVHLALPGGIYRIAASHCRCVIFHPMPQTDDGTMAAGSSDALRALAQRSDVVAIGPGLTTHQETKQVVLRLIAETEVTVVIDADAINALAESTEILSKAAGPRILTPHPGEMARLTGTTTAEIRAAREETATAFASEHNITLALKGRGTIVTNGDCLYVNRSGNHGMATAGSGDVLTGLIAGLAAQGMAPFEATQLGVYLHGMAGDKAEEAFTAWSMTAQDILGCVPETFKRYGREQRQS